MQSELSHLKSARSTPHPHPLPQGERGPEKNLSDIIEIFCLDCGYDLRGIEQSERCPECGAAIDRGAVGRSRIPWTRRAEIGRVRAYAQTLWLVLSRPRRLAEEVGRPVRLSDAKRFRLITLIIALIGPAVASALLYGDLAGRGPWPIIPSAGTFGTPPAYAGPASESPHRLLGWALAIGVVGAVWLGCWLFLASASLVASVFFHPPGIAMERQNRAVAVSYYAAAPWALLPLVFLCLTTWLTLSSGGYFRRIHVPIWVILSTAAVVVVPLVQIVSTYAAPLAMLRRATSCGVERLLLAAITLPIAWVILAAIFLIALPAAYLFVTLVVMSLVT
jgi:hypothetical protein